MLAATDRGPQILSCMKLNWSFQCFVIGPWNGQEHWPLTALLYTLMVSVVRVPACCFILLSQ